MVRFNKKISHKTRGQAMAEFALTIPVFFLLVFGIIELSRFFLVYSSVFTAVREATRYGSSMGDQANPNYQNCEMIAETAVRMGNFGGVQTDDVTVYFESEPGTWVADCDPDDDPEDRYQPVLGDRVVVEIDTAYDSLLGVVPDLTVSAENGRTIMLGINQQVAVVTTEDPEGESTPEPTEGTNTPEPTENTTTPEPTEVTTTPEPTLDTSTPEPSEEVCPTEIIEFVGPGALSPNEKTITLKLRNNTGQTYELIYFDKLNWTRKPDNKVRYMNSINWGSIAFGLTNLEPPTGLVYLIQSPDIKEVVTSNQEVDIKFNFSEKNSSVDISLKIRLSLQDGTCPIELFFP